MKILIYGINYAPELTGIGKYSAEMAEWLAARGHSVSVVTAPPYYPQWRVHDGYRAGRYAREERAACPCAAPGVPARPGGVKRLLHLASFALSSLPSLLRAPPGGRRHPGGRAGAVLRARGMAGRQAVRRSRLAARAGL